MTSRSSTPNAGINAGGDFTTTSCGLSLDRVVGEESSSDGSKLNSPGGDVCGETRGFRSDKTAGDAEG